MNNIVEKVIEGEASTGIHILAHECRQIFFDLDIPDISSTFCQRVNWKSQFSGRELRCPRWYDK